MEMTKELIKRHGTVIKWYCDNPNKGVWVRLMGGKTWNLTHKPEFTEFDTFVQNDEYSELRMALKEGKKLELNDGCCEIVQSWNPAYPDKTPLETYPVNLYRIKPKHTFKAGQWVVSREYGVIRLTKTNADSYNISDDTHNQNSKTYTVPWEPRDGEWCFFWDIGTDRYTVARYKRTTDSGMHVTLNTESFENMAPLSMVNSIGEHKDGQ